MHCTSAITQKNYTLRIEANIVTLNRMRTPNETASKDKRILLSLPPQHLIYRLTLAPLSLLLTPTQHIDVY